MQGPVVRSISTGLSQKGVRNHNERLLLSLLQRHGEMPGSDLARFAGLSPPAVSAILRRLETEGLLKRGDPVRGKVGKPSIPISLDADGVLSLGLKIGRRTADLLLLDFVGEVRHQIKTAYKFPVPAAVFDFLAQALRQIMSRLTSGEISRICGIGVAAPFEFWDWHGPNDAPPEDILRWKQIDFASEIGRFVNLPVSVMNDATAACRAEHVYGRGKAFQDYAYFFVGAFVGGGVVLNNSVLEGHQGNAGALGSLRSIGPNGESRQLVDTASIHLLETRLAEVDLDPQVLWTSDTAWTNLSRHVDPWLGQTAQELAKACLSTCAVIDFEAILIDGAFPAVIRNALVERVRRYIVHQDLRGLIQPRIEAGSMGINARAIGAACAPIFEKFFLDTNAGLSLPDQ